MTDLSLKIRHAKRQNSQNLDFSNLSLSSLSVDLFSLKTLLNLNLSKNKLTTLEKEIENLTNLVELNLESNLITSLPIELNKLQNLKIVKISDNPIAEKLQDWNLNWKESLKEYTNQENKLSTSEEITKEAKQPSEKDVINISKKVPFNFNMNSNKISLMNNTFTTFKKEQVAEIPKCDIFNMSSSNNIKKSQPTESIKNFPIITNPVRIQSGNLNKRNMLNSIIKSKVTVTNNIAETIKDKEDNNLISNKEFNQAETHGKKSEVVLNELNQLKLEIESYKMQIQNYKGAISKREAEQKNEIKKLEEEIKFLKTSLTEIKPEPSKPEMKQEPSKVNRNWMDESPSTSNQPVLPHKMHTRVTVEDEGRIKDLEMRLLKEEQTNKRLRSDVERLTSLTTQLKSVKPSQSLDITKNVLQIDYEEIDVGSKIGQGGFSIIYKGIWSGLAVAVKLIFDPNITEDLLNEFNNEIKMLYSLRHPNIILLLGVCLKPQKLSIITEFGVNGSLFETLHRSNKEINLANKVRIIEQLIRALAFIHYKGVVHRDIKSHNVLLDENLNVKLCDFGLAKFKSELNLGSGQFAGTPAYMAPELFMKQAYDEKVDIYAFGTLVWEILVRKVPYHGYDVADIKSRVVKDEPLFIPKSVNFDFANLINSCRSADPNKRPSFAEINKLKFTY